MRGPRKEFSVTGVIFQEPAELPEKWQPIDLSELPEDSQPILILDLHPKRRKRRGAYGVRNKKR